MSPQGRSLLRSRPLFDERSEVSEVCWSPRTHGCMGDGRTTSSLDPSGRITMAEMTYPFDRRSLIHSARSISDHSRNRALCYGHPHRIPLGVTINLGQTDRKATPPKNAPPRTPPTAS